MAERALFAPFPLHASRAANAAVLASMQFQKGESVEPSRLLPVYLRASDAEINRSIRQATDTAHSKSKLDSSR
jgi:hypothetical protein